MPTLHLKSRVDPEGHVRLDIPTTLPHGEVDLLVIISSTKESRKPYDFQDLVGRLRWEGDAVMTQRLLRDEW